MAETKPKPRLAQRDILLSAEKADWLAGLLWRMARNEDYSRPADVSKIREWCHNTLALARRQGGLGDIRSSSRRALAAIRQYRKSLNPSWLHRDLLDSLEATLRQVAE